MKLPITRRFLPLLLGVAALALVMSNYVDRSAQDPISDLVVAPGYSVTTWAKDLERPRVMVETAGGDLIVSTYRGGSVLLVKKDADGDGVSDGSKVLLPDQNSPHGLLVENDTLFVAEENRISKYQIVGDTLTNRQTVLDGLPDDGDHASRTLARGPDGWLYVSIGSSCNRCIEENPWRAAIIRFKEGGKPEIFAKGLRNTVGFDWHPVTGKLYGVNAGSDLLGDDIPPEELNLIEQGKHYGWPYFHSTDFKDPKYWSKRPKGVEFVPPVHSFTAHSTPLSIRFLKGTAMPTALVGRRGSWNRSVKSGYDVVKLTWQPDGTITQSPFLTGFVKNEEASGRPVDTLQIADGSIFISDDTAGVIYKVAPVK
ncbi:L-sorbosone dehydrogenase [hydrothermal vent metagenome]|uniref:L-sorbosone dehydrogenase n=1 Tax=hydrothermal vent metagenome TaxID=652676 RepID=A0A3B0S745_9ZZZZ